MDIIKRKIITVFLIVLLIGIILAIGYIITGKIPETFDIMNKTIPISKEPIPKESIPKPTNQSDIKTIPSNGIIPNDYYKIDGTNTMAKLPYGYYAIDSNYMAILPYGYLKIDSNYMAKVPSGYYPIDYTTAAKLPYGTTLGPAPTTAIIPDGYYKVTVDNTQQLAQVPYGYTANSDKTDIYPTTKSSTYGNAVVGNSMTSGLFTGTPNADVRTSYNSDNLDLQYHDDANAIIAQDGINNASFNSVNVLDQYGIMKTMPYAPSQSLPIYYSPGSFVFGASSYVPNYEDSVYLSRTTGLSTVGQAYVTSSMNGGFCNTMSTNSLSVEQKCQSLPPDVCSSTSCCVLLGGSKCVAGDGSGPTMKANYTDPSILNKDVYYYQGKCYGNCS